MHRSQTPPESRRGWMDGWMDGSREGIERRETRTTKTDERTKRCRSNWNRYAANYKENEKLAHRY